MAGLNDIIDRRSSNMSTSSRTPIDEQYLQYLIDMYHAYEDKGLPFNEQVRVLSLIPESWNLSSGFIEEKFNCSSYAVKLARRLNKETSIPLHLEEKMYELLYNIFSFLRIMGKFAFRTTFSLRTPGVVVCYDLLTVKRLHGVRKEVRNEKYMVSGMERAQKFGMKCVEELVTNSNCCLIANE